MHDTPMPPPSPILHPAKGRSRLWWELANAAAYTPLTLLIACLLTLILATAAYAQRCPPAPTTVRDLDLERYYSDHAGTKIDAEKRAAKRTTVAPLKNFMTDLAKGADRTWKTSQPNSSAATCPLNWLKHWAKSDALLGKMATKQADYERKWALAGLAVSYVKLRPFATLDQRRTIDAWLIRLADTCRAFFDNPGRKRNNHWYWLGLGVAATGLATESKRHWDEARHIMHDAANDIQADGTLPMELKRGKRALHYHNFSAQPLFAMTLLARAKGEDWASFNGGAMRRLALFMSAAICSSKPVIAMEALPRQDSISEKDLESGWLQQYVALNPSVDDAACARPARSRSRPSNYHRLGGDLNTLLRALRAAYK